MSNSDWLEHGIDVRRRTILLSGDVDYKMADTVLKGLPMMAGTRPVRFLINSGGGDDDPCRAIIGAIHSAPMPVHGHVMGIAESAAAWIFQHCAQRTMYFHSSLMFHLGESTKDKHNKYIDRLFVEDVLRRMHEKDSSYPRTRLVAHLESDWYVYPTQALELGLTDHVVGG